MKILSIGNFYNPSWDSSIPDEEHIANALESLGHVVVRYQRELVDKGLMMSPEERRTVDFCLIAQWDNYPDWTIRQIKEIYNCPVVYWAFDYQADGQEWHEKLIAGADLYLSKRIADSKYPNWQWLSQDFAPMFLDKAPDVERDIDVLFTGSYLPWATERNEALKAVDEKFSLTIHSVTPDEWRAQGFKNVHGPVMDDALPELIARAKINLSIDHTLEAGYWSDRNAQIMACGGLVLFRYIPLSEARFISGTLVPFYDKEHCLEEIETLLSMHEEDLDAIRTVGYEWAHRNLMVENRVNDLLTIVESVL